MGPQKPGDLLKRLNSPFVSALVATTLFGLFLVARLYPSGFDFSLFVVAGDRLCDPALVPPNLTVLRQSDGYDGQYYYRLSLHPFTSQQTEFGITLDAPAYRQQRILYPLLNWVFALGNPALIPVTMVLINFLSLCVLAWIGGAYAQAFKQHALWGIFLPLCPGLLFTLSRDLVEILEITLLTGSLLLVRDKRFVPGTLLLALAVLTKETALLVAVGASLVYLFKWRTGDTGKAVRWYYFAVPMVVFCLWQITLFYNWGQFPFSGSETNILGVPLVAPARLFLDVAGLQDLGQRRTFLELVFLLGFGGAVFNQLRSSRATAVEIVPCLLYAALALSLTRAVWIEDWSFFRATSQFCALGTMILIATEGKTRAFIFGCSALFWLYVAGRLVP